MYSYIASLASYKTSLFGGTLVLFKQYSTIKTLSTYHIHITGLVQGVGFRPHVYQLAITHALFGWVNNSNSGVHIEFNATNEKANQFYQQVIDLAPALSIIVHHSITITNGKEFSSFIIQQSDDGPVENLMLTPDYAICDSCNQELFDNNNCRFQYPFTTCTHCGPRYSIIQQLPYDRVNTSMNYFELCAACQAEYDNPADRRHFAQTNSCKACGIQLTMFTNTGKEISDNYETIIEKTVAALHNGNIVAAKGIGGYLLLCDATNENCIIELRKRKHRLTKPFALMYATIQRIGSDFELSQQEADILQSVIAPITLITPNASAGTLCKHTIAPGLLHLGVMLPYTAFFKLVATAFQQPIIATSANVADSPVIFNDEEAMLQLKSIADFIVCNNRVITTPQDDSVIKFTPLSRQKIILRRSRGMAPSYFGYVCNSHEAILATGALLKSSFTFTNNSTTFISQYLGNIESYEAQLAYQKTVQHFIQLFHQEPQVIIADKHPLYFSTQLAIELSREYSCPLIQVQHHKAHAAAVLAENTLLDSQKLVLCVVWDGTGLGDDGNIWGGEFFVYENNKLNRRYHFDYFPIILGDKMPKEPRLSALCICSEVWMAEDMLSSKFSETEWALYQKIVSKTDNLQCSSVGRIFDAVASLLNLADKQTYEGEAALLLETLAQQYFSVNGYHFSESYFMQGAHLHKIPTATLFAKIITDLKIGKPFDYIAAKFHFSLVQLIEIVAANLQLHQITFSGGVFQNAVLVDLIKQHLSSSHLLFFHKNLSPNDENISFGQMVYYDHDIDDIRIRLEKKVAAVDVTNDLSITTNNF